MLSIADSKMLKAGSLLLSSCWKHYGILLHLEDRKFYQQWKELFDQYLSGIQVALLNKVMLFTLLMVEELGEKLFLFSFE